jgi:hypothetical protein
MSWFCLYSRRSLSTSPETADTSNVIGRFTLYGTKRHDTKRQKPACIHIYRRLTDRQNILFFQSKRHYLCLCLSLHVGDRLVWIPACQTHSRIICRVVSCRDVTWRDVPYNVNRPYHCNNFVWCTTDPKLGSIHIIRQGTAQHDMAKYSFLFFTSWNSH